MAINIQEVDNIKKILISSIASDDDLMEQMILKGGNAISLGYGLSERPSYDLDYSLEDDFEDHNVVFKRLEELISEGLNTNNYHLYDFNYKIKPMSQTQNHDFWGGYEILFKVISLDKWKEYNYDEEKARRGGSVVFHENGSPTFSVDISKFEYVEKKKLTTINDINLYIYLPLLIVAEKIRALCQRVPEYTTEILQQKEKRLKSRARDFYDIYILKENFPFEHKSDEFIQTLSKVFEAKRVPLDYVYKIYKMKEYHASDFLSVKETSTDKVLKENDFDFFFDYVINIINELNIGDTTSH